MSCLGKSYIWIIADLFSLLLFKMFWMVGEQLCINKSLLPVLCALITFNIIMTNARNRSSNANERLIISIGVLDHSVKAKNV